jgi:hypothetical protein
MRALVVCAVVSACASGKPAATTPPTAPPPPIAAPHATQSGDGPTVTIVDPGEMPRRVLRYTFRAGSVEYLELDLKTVVTMTMDDPTMGSRSTQTALPTMRSLIRLATKELTPEGDARVEFEWETVKLLDDVAIDPQMRARVEAELGGFTGLRTTARLSTRGVPSEIVTDVPKTASGTVKASVERMRDSIRQMYVPFPEGAVGRHARWDVATRIPISNVSVTAKYRYNLSAVGATSVVCRVETTMAAASQVMATESGMTTVLDSMTGGGTGTVTLPLDHLVPVGTSNVSMASEFTVATGPTEKLHAKMHMIVEVATRPLAAK